MALIDDCTLDMLVEIRDYVEEVEVKIDGEWGSGRTVEQLIAAGYMPDFYPKICKMIAERSGSIATENAA